MKSVLSDVDVKDLCYISAQSMLTNLFALATQRKYRFAKGGESPKKNITLESLWDLDINSVDEVAKNLYGDLQKGSGTIVSFIKSAEIDQFIRPIVVDENADYDILKEKFVIVLSILRYKEKVKWNRNKLDEIEVQIDEAKNATEPCGSFSESLLKLQKEKSDINSCLEKLLVK